ncbi:MAG TPA: response regulator [Methylomirabilota bacterium]|jgi:CheY-like chemotaxis protein/phosphoribosyl 1,2-cyclic phosphodiesterase|nr:response regulator [Methylomirabilota bacterium]
MRIRFWGTRGSLAKPGPATVRYGGNTSCVEVRTADGTLIVLDCGTGAHDLGRALLASGEPARRGHLLISHTHWDHIQGFPFFAPLFTPECEWDVYAPRGLSRSLEATLAGQMEYAYFPITLAQMGASIRYHDIVEGAFEAGGVAVVARYLNHPALALGYRLEADGVKVVYATDHEPHSRHQPLWPMAASAPAAPIHPEDQRHIDFLAGADLVVHDAQYTEAEYPAKMTWGHSSAAHAVDFAVAAGARRLALFHHDPIRDDAAIDRLVDVCRARAAGVGSPLEVFAAAEGQGIDLEPAGKGSGLAPASTRDPLLSSAASARPATILIADDDAEVVSLLSDALAPGGFRLLCAFDGETALALARSELPDLILLDWSMPRRDGLQVCRAVRDAEEPRLRGVPVVLLTARTTAEDTQTGFKAGATDYIVKPFKPAHVRSRVESWLLRGSAPTRP